MLFVAQTAAAQVTVVGDSVDFAWAPAQGQPDGYRVSIAWDGTAPTFYAVVTPPEVTVAVNPGDRLAIQVEALRSLPGGGFEVGPPSELSGEVVVEAPTPEEADFDSGTNGFTYADDAFRGTGEGIYAEGVHDTQEGYTGGSVRIDLGGVDDDDILGISGAWSNDIFLADPTVVTISLRTRITTSGTFESDECIESLIAVDGALFGSGGDEHLLRQCGTTSQSDVATDTGWHQRTVTIWLSSGAHTIEIGGYASKKTSESELASVYFDDVSITTTTESLFAEPATVHVGSALQGGSDVLTQDVVVDTSDGNAKGFSVSSDQSWASATPGSSTTPATIEIEVDPTSLGIGEHTATLTIAGNGVSNTTLPVAVNVLPGGVFTATFDSDDEGFTYVDDLFRGTNQPGYASGGFSGSDGFDGGGLRLDLGGVDRDTVLDMSGGFERQFFVPAAADYAIHVRTRMVFSDAYETDECSQILIAVDGYLEGYGGNDFRDERCGDPGTTQDTDWYDETVIVSLSAGAHTLTLGGYGNKKTFEDETTQIFVDDVVVEGYLPEPGAMVGVLSGGSLVGMLGRRRRRRR